MNAALRLTGSDLGSDLGSFLRSLAAAPHSAHRKAEEAMERMERECPWCNGAGKRELADIDGKFDCWHCEGTGCLPLPEPEPDLPESEADKRADYYAEEEDNQRYLMDLNGEDAA